MSTMCELEVPGLSSTHESHAGSGKLLPATRQRVADWQRDPDVRGLLLVGSKSLGFADRYSDDDLYVVLTESAYQRRLGSRPFEWFTQRGPGLPQVLYDICYTSVSALSDRLDSPRDVDHWEFQQSELLFDRDGTLASLTQALAAMPRDFRRKRLMHGTLDAHMAQHRANKTSQRGGAHFIVKLLVLRSVQALIRVVFALEWRWVPLDHWLEQELADLADPANVTFLLAEALSTGDRHPVVNAIQQLAPLLEKEDVPGGGLSLGLMLLHPDAAAERRIHGLY